MSDTKYQWLEQKCKEYQHDNQKLKDLCKRFEKVSIDRRIPTEMYYNEVEYINKLFTTALKGNNESYQLFMKISVPHSYNDLEHITLPEFKQHFVTFMRSIKNYIDFVDKCNYNGPIFTQITSETNLSILDKVTFVNDKIIKFDALLQTERWALNVPDSSRATRDDMLKWLQSTTEMLLQVNACLNPIHDLSSV